MGRPTKDEQQEKKRELTAKQLAFAVWHASLKAGRVPETEQQLCDQLNMTRQTAWKWRQDPKVVEAIRYLALQQAGTPDKIAAMLDMLHDVAIAKQDVRAGEVWLKGVGVYGQFQRSSGLLDAVEAEVGDFKDFSLEELEALQAQLPADGTSEDLALERAKSLLANRP